MCYIQFRMVSYVIQAVRAAITGRPGVSYLDMTGAMIEETVDESIVMYVTFLLYL